MQKILCVSSFRLVQVSLEMTHRSSRTKENKVITQGHFCVMVAFLSVRQSGAHPPSSCSLVGRRHCQKMIVAMLKSIFLGTNDEASENNSIRKYDATHAGPCLNGGECFAPHLGRFFGPSAAGSELFLLILELTESFKFVEHELLNRSFAHSPPEASDFFMIKT